MLLLMTSLIPMLKETSVSWPRNQEPLVSLLSLFFRENKIKAPSNQFTNFGNTIHLHAGAARCFSFITSMQTLMCPGFIYLFCIPLLLKSRMQWRVIQFFNNNFCR